MNISDLRCVVQVDRIKSISQAADLLYMSQSTLSRVVREVEQETGIVLFQRTNKGVVTTQEGERFITRIKALLEDIDKLERQYFRTNASRPEELTLLLATQRSSPVVDAFAQFYKQYCLRQAHFNLAILENTRENVLTLVADRACHLGVVLYMSNEADSLLRNCEKLGLSCCIIDDSPVYVQISKEHPLAGKAAISPEMLRPYPHITFIDEDLTGINYCSDIFQYNRNILDKRILVQDRGTLRHLISETDGYYLGNNAICALPTQHRTAYVPLKDYPHTIRTACVYSSSHSLSREESLFIDTLEKLFSRSKSSHNA